MPRTQEIENIIPELYRSSILNASMFAFVKGAREALHTLTIEQSVDMFMEVYGLNDDTYNRESAVTTFGRMNKKLIELIKIK